MKKMHMMAAAVAGLTLIGGVPALATGSHDQPAPDQGPRCEASHQNHDNGNLAGPDWLPAVNLNALSMSMSNLLCGMTLENNVDVSADPDDEPVAVSSSDGEPEGYDCVAKHENRHNGMLFGMININGLSNSMDNTLCGMSVVNNVSIDLGMLGRL